MSTHNVSYLTYYICSVLIKKFIFVHLSKENLMFVRMHAWASGCVCVCVTQFFLFYSCKHSHFIFN